MWTATLGNSKTQVAQQELQALEILPLTSHLKISGSLVRKFTRPERVPFGSHRVMTKDHHLGRLFFPVMADAYSTVKKKKKEKRKKKTGFLTQVTVRGLDDFARMAAVLNSQMRCASPPSGLETCQTSAARPKCSRVHKRTRVHTLAVRRAPSMWSLLHSCGSSCSCRTYF